MGVRVQKSKVLFGWVRFGSVKPVRTGWRFCAVRFLCGSVRGSYRFRGSFWNIWGLKMLKTCTPPRAPGNAGEYRTCAVFVRREGILHSLLLRRSNKQGWGCWAGDAGPYRFWNIWGLKVLKTCTPRARPKQCRGMHRTCAVFVWREGTAFVTSSEKQ